ncbi:MAG TPA: FUSC family membrane protein, partial [Eoetvoesiella sp.]
AIGVLLPAVVLGGLLQLYSIGMVAAIGAACVATIDQPGGPRRYGTNAMLGALLLGTLTAALTGVASSHPLLTLIIVPAFVFLFSMFSVYGKLGGLIGFACLLIMTLTLRAPLTPQEAMIHTLCSFLGGVFYFFYSYTLHRLLWFREEQQTLSVALFATADYMFARSRFYDVNHDIEASYRKLIHSQSDMTEKHQAARNMVLRELPKGSRHADRHHIASLNIFIDMVALLDSLVATHTDYATLRRSLPDSDFLIFSRDALHKLSNNVAHIALSIARNQRVNERVSVKAELRAIEYELEQYRQNGFAQTTPEIYALLVQILRRLRNATRVVERMAEHTRYKDDAVLVDTRLDKSLDRFITHRELRLGQITSNLRFDSSHFRYALRVTIATILAIVITTLLAQFMPQQGITQGLGTHSYWVILTIVVIMKPGFALTRQRNGWRLIGTLIGCALALGLFNLTQNVDLYFTALVAACVLGYSLLQVNFMAAAIFNTLFVLLVFHFLSPNSHFIIGERLFDTFIGCSLALLCSYILPWWEHSFMPSLANAAKNANQKYFNTGLQYAALSRAQLNASEASPDQQVKLDAQVREADMAWRLARKNAHIAFGNFASAFYRMMDEPIRRQNNVPELNNLLIQNHVLGSQISAAVPILAALRTVPENIQKSLDAVDTLLSGQDADPPASIETDDELAALAYPLRQMVKAAQLIRQEMRGLEEPLAASRTGRPRKVRTA